MIYTITYNPAIDYKLEVDSFIEGHLNRTTSNYYIAGGKGINVSMVLKNLGVESIALGYVGGFTGEYIKNHLTNDLNIKHNFIEVSENTRVNVKLKNKELETEINSSGPVITKEEHEQMLEFISNLKCDDVVVVGGSAAKGEASSYKDICKICNEKGIKFVVDTSKKNLLEVLQYQPYLIKPNVVELEELFEVSIKNEEEIIHYANELLQLGAKNIIVSLGKDGSIFLNSEVIYKASPISGNVVNTVGAGDSMVAGFVAGINKLTTKEAYKQAVACGTATAFSKGLANEENVQKYMKEILVTDYENK